MPSCNTYRLAWVSLTLGVGYLFKAVLAKCSRCSLPWMRGISSPPAPPDLERGIAPLGSPGPVQPPLLGGVVAPPGRRPWPRVWGSSSQPFLRHCSLALSAAAPDLRRQVTPLGRLPSGMGSSRLLPLTLDMGWLLSAVLWRAGSSRLGL